MSIGGKRINLNPPCHKCGQPLIVAACKCERCPFTTWDCVGKDCVNCEVHDGVRYVAPLRCAHCRKKNCRTGHPRCEPGPAGVCPTTPRRAV